MHKRDDAEDYQILSLSLDCPDATRHCPDNELQPSTGTLLRRLDVVRTHDLGSRNSSSHEARVGASS